MKSFDISDPHVIPQFNLIAHVLYKRSHVCHIAYTSNWYIVIACTTKLIAAVIKTKINCVGTWEMEHSPGRKNKYYYIKLSFNQSI